MKKATFTQRLLAYIIDIIIVSLVASIVASSFTSKKLENLEKELSETMTQYTSGEITLDEYLNTTKDLTYEIEKKSITVNILYLVLNIGYFIIFQLLNNGQTLGKKLMKIRIVNQEDKNLTIIQMIIRTSIINQIIPNLFVILLVLLLSKNIFFNTYYIVVGIEYIFIIISTLMILYRQDKLGLHDILSKTKVVKEGA